MIRPFERKDARGVAALLRPLVPDWIVTERGLLHWTRTIPERARLGTWVADDGGAIVGFGESFFHWDVSAEGLARVWVAVRRDARGRGIGGELYSRAEDHIREQGARALESFTYEDPAAQRFLENRGFGRSRSEQCWTLDPRGVDVSELAELEAAKSSEGFRLVPLRALHDREADLYRLFAETHADVPADHPGDNIGYEEWREHVFGDPDLDRDGSFVVLAGSEPVSFAWLLVDREGARAIHMMTGTRRDFRRRGLARLAKLATIRWAAENAIAALATNNDTENGDMLALNEHLGYEPTVTAWQFRRDVSAAGSGRGR